MCPSPRRPRRPRCLPRQQWCPPCHRHRAAQLRARWAGAVRRRDQPRNRRYCHHCPLCECLPRKPTGERRCWSPSAPLPGVGTSKHRLAHRKWTQTPWQRKKFSTTKNSHDGRLRRHVLRWQGQTRRAAHLLNLTSSSGRNHTRTTALSPTTLASAALPPAAAPAAAVAAEAEPRRHELTAPRPMTSARDVRESAIMTASATHTTQLPALSVAIACV